MREIVSCKLKIDFGKDEDEKSIGSWTFSKIDPDADAEQLYMLGAGLNSLQDKSAVEFSRVSQHILTK